MINHHKLPSCGAVSTFCLYYQHLQYAIHEIKNLKDRTTLPGKFSIYSKGSRANLKQYLPIYQYSVPSSQKLRGHIHIEVATQNVNLTLWASGWVFKVPCWRYTILIWRKHWKNTKRHLHNISLLLLSAFFID